MPLNHLLMVVAFTLMGLWYLNIWMVYSQYSILNHSVVTCAYLLLSCLVSYNHCNFFIRVIMFSLLITRMFICIYLLVSIIVIFTFVWQSKPYQGKVLPFRLATSPRDFTSLTKPIFLSTRVFVYYFFRRYLSFDSF